MNRNSSGEPCVGWEWWCRREMLHRLSGENMVFHRRPQAMTMDLLSMRYEKKLTQNPFLILWKRKEKQINSLFATSVCHCVFLSGDKTSFHSFVSDTKVSSSSNAYDCSISALLIFRFIRKVPRNASAPVSWMKLWIRKFWVFYTCTGNGVYSLETKAKMFLLLLLRFAITEHVFTTCSNTFQTIKEE